MKPRILSIHAYKSLQNLSQQPAHNLGDAPNRLRQWLLKNQVTVRQFAMMVCMNRRSLDTILRGEFRSKSGYIQLHQAFAIEWATQGEVPAWLWLELPANQRRIRESHLSHIKEFEATAKRHVLKWGSLAQPEGRIRDKARALSRLFGVQWGEVKARAWRDAEKKAKLERANIKHLLTPEETGPDDNGVYYRGEDNEAISDEEWFNKITKGG